MYIFFIIVVFVSLIIFLSKKRYFDFLSIYFILLLLYNISTLVGIVYDPVYSVMEKPHEYTYLVSGFPFIFATIFILFKQPTQSEDKLNFIKAKFLLNKKYNILLILLFILAIYSFYSSIKIVANATTKQELLDSRNLLSLMLAPLPTFAIMVAYLKNKRKLLYFLYLLVVILFFFGGRALLVSSVLCFLILVFYNKKIKIIQKKWLITCAAIGLFVVILGKRLYGYVLGFGLIDGITNWYKDFNSSFLLSGSEFITNTAILNEVILNDFSIPWEDFFLSFLSILPIPVSYFSLNSGVFNERFQSELFSDVEYGMAYSIWAEAYSWSGLFGVILISFLLPFTLYKLWNLYNKYAHTIWGPIIILIGFTVAFWCHRNSIGTILANVRNVIYPLIFIWLVSSFISKYLIRKR